MNAKLFKNIISAISDDAEIMVETKPDEEWKALQSISVKEDADGVVSVYLNYFD